MRLDYPAGVSVYLEGPGKGGVTEHLAVIGRLPIDEEVTAHFPPGGAHGSHPLGPVVGGYLGDGEPHQGQLSGGLQHFL